MTDVDEQLPHPATTAAAGAAAAARARAVHSRQRRFRWPWKRARLSREKFVEWLKTMVWVVPLTIIIWIYAEREQIPDNYPPVDGVTVQVTSSDPSRFIEVSSDPNRFVESTTGARPEVSLRLTGPQEGLEKVRDLLAQVPSPLQIDLSDSLRPSPEWQRINVVSHIGNLPIFRSNGVSVLDSTPPELLVMVDDVAEKTVDVQLPPGLANVDASATTIEPGQARVRGPKRLLDGVAIYADLPRSGSSLRAGVHMLNDVPLMLAHSDQRITILPPRKATVRLTVLAADETYTLPGAVPVYIQEPLSLQQAYDIKWDPIVTDVKVIGPHDKIEQLRAGGGNARAVLELSIDDIGHSPKAVSIVGLPEGVRVSPDSAGKMVAFTLTPRGG